jgi:hypothetical protein
MEIPLIIRNSLYDAETVNAWQFVWETVCLMAYERKSMVRELITAPGLLIVDGMVNTSKLHVEHSEIYREKVPHNDEEITLDYMWKIYSRSHGDAFIIDSFKHLHVPRSLFENLGIKKWFEYSFPNCKVTFWNEF